MKKTFFITFICLLFAVISNAQQDSAIRRDSSKVRGRSATGVISHKYSKCGTVILIIDKQRKDTSVVIPYGYKLGVYDKDGTVISFKYVPLMIRNPGGCRKGGPVRIWDVVGVPVKHKHKHVQGS